MSDQEESELEALLEVWGAEEARLERRKAFVEGVLERNRAAREAERAGVPTVVAESSPATGDASPDSAPLDENGPRLRVVSGRGALPDAGARARLRRRWLGVALPLAAAAGLGFLLLVRGGGPLETTAPSAGHGSIQVDPSADLTRSTLVALLDRDLASLMPAIGPDRERGAVASDLPPDDPARAWIARGVLTAEGGRFDPGRNVTRAELVMALYDAIGSALGRPPTPLHAEAQSRFGDVAPDHFAYSAVGALVPSIVRPRTDSVFGVQDIVSNGQADEAVRAAARKVVADRGNSN